jgi:hypothetical protein
MDKFINIVPVNPFVSLVSNVSNIIRTNKKENFTEKEETNDVFPGIFFAILLFIISILISIVYIYIFIRFVLVAFKCGTGDGLLAMFLTYPYIAWKFTDMLRTNCDTSKSAYTWF